MGAEEQEGRTELEAGSQTETPPNNSDLAITTALMLCTVFRLVLHRTEGSIGSILHLLGLALPVPDHSTIGWHARIVKLPAYRA